MTLKNLIFYFIHYKGCQCIEVIFRSDSPMLICLGFLPPVVRVLPLRSYPRKFIPSDLLPPVDRAQPNHPHQRRECRVPQVFVLEGDSS